MAPRVLCSSAFAVGSLTVLLTRSSMGLSIKERVGPRYAFDYRYHGEDWTAGQCGSRERQSPVNFGKDAPWTCQATSASPTRCQATPVYYDYDKITEGFKVTSNGRELVVDMMGMGFGGITFDNLWFDIKVVSIHAGSEHTFHGQRFPLELQLMHASSDSERVVAIAVPIRGAVAGEVESTGVTEALKSLFVGLPLPAPGESSRDVKVEQPQEILNPLIDGGSFFVYGGSQTVPPCTAQTTWIVRREPLIAANFTLETARAGANAANSGDLPAAENWRAPMPLMGRHVGVLYSERGKPPLQPEDEEVPLHPPAGITPFKGVKAVGEGIASVNRAAELSDRLYSNMYAPVVTG